MKKSRSVGCCHDRPLSFSSINDDIIVRSLLSWKVAVSGKTRMAWHPKRSPLNLSMDGRSVVKEC